MHPELVSFSGFCSGKLWHSEDSGTENLSKVCNAISVLLATLGCFSGRLFGIGTSTVL